MVDGPMRCILSKFYIKPQHNEALLDPSRVVSYRNSTSNHNHIDTVRVDYMLYLIEILHQTTTLAMMFLRVKRCILSKFYIKPQHATMSGGSAPSCILSKFYIKPQQGRVQTWRHRSCILSKFYIKPQQHSDAWRRFYVVSYRNSTSNHNSSANCIGVLMLYLIEILHQTTTRRCYRFQ